MTSMNLATIVFVILSHFITPGPADKLMLPSLTTVENSLPPINSNLSSDQESQYPLYPSEQLVCRRLAFIGILIFGGYWIMTFSTPLIGKHRKNLSIFGLFLVELAALWICTLTLRITWGWWF